MELLTEKEEYFKPPPSFFALFLTFAVQKYAVDCFSHPVPAQKGCPVGVTKCCPHSSLHQGCSRCPPSAAWAKGSLGEGASLALS